MIVHQAIQMGHVRLGRLPRTKHWNDVVRLIGEDGDIELVAAASARAAENGLDRASRDPALVHAFWLLTQLPQAARGPGFSDRLNELGLVVSSQPSLLEIVGAFANALDRETRTVGGRFDFGEMAQLAATELLASLVGREAATLFGTTAADVQEAIARLGSSSRFSVLAREFFSRLTQRSLGYFLSLELSNHVGFEKRFASISQHTNFNIALDQHCREASRIIKEFAGEWYGKTIFEQGGSARRRLVILPM